MPFRIHLVPLHAGAVGHARDYRKAAGGFIHGFRYTAQALVKDLLRRFHDEPWPSRALASKPSPWHVEGVQDSMDTGAAVKVRGARGGGGWGESNGEGEGKKR